MESLLSWLTELGPHAPLIIFALLMVTGFSLPVSEDLILLASGILASTILPEYVVQLFLAAYLGSFLSDCIAFGLGRLFGEKINTLKTDGKMQRLARFYEKYGFWTLFVGRCIPFGVRNGIFMTAGAGKMKFRTFLISDGLACLGFSGLLFFLAYSAGTHYDSLVATVQQTSFVVGLVFLAFIGSISLYLLTKRKKARQIPTQIVP